MPYKEKQTEKKYYTIGDVAEEFGVATSLIRFWETEFDIINPKKNQKGHRFFTKQDLDNVKVVYQLVKEQGYTLTGAKEILKNRKKKAEDTLETINSLKKVKAFLKELQGKLD